MKRSVAVRVILCVPIMLLLAVPSGAGRFVAVPDTDGPCPEAPADYSCRIQGVVNRDPPCDMVRWTYGGWCIGDEVAHLVALDPCYAACYSPLEVWLDSAEVEFRCIPPHGYPFTTLPFDCAFRIYELDWALSTPECSVPAPGYRCEGVVVTIPSRTITSSADPARSFIVTFPFTPGCSLSNYWHPHRQLFGALTWVSIPSRALPADCGQSGIDPSIWWIPGIRGANGGYYDDWGYPDCSTPCAQYYRNSELHGETWIDGAFVTDFGWFFNLYFYDCATPVERTTWGKIRGLMHE
jgi:hypothetical protein